MVLKHGDEEMSLSQTNIQLEQINEPCSGRSVHSYTSPNYVCLRCHRISSPNYPLGLLIGLLYTNLRASTVLQRAEAVLWTALHSLQYRSGGRGRGSIDIMNINQTKLQATAKCRHSQVDASAILLAKGSRWRCP